ncbi:MAG: hypothetical protein HRU30_11390 [Rhodobacteraceae bacterium]|nr:hypothetical protein [Paracoccaceae bacterium]
MHWGTCLPALELNTPLIPAHSGIGIQNASLGRVRAPLEPTNALFGKSNIPFTLKT